ncbi:MAG: formylglycine-generating enzyme family protein [Polyangiaceae bacterium]|nr:formylglycine-generating enzyme family protein [Myxococcales bacterium]MCB9590108.1 formylglycine-generating enzyme family protein [Polyangiaceae bacterium]MCB9607987.1 formylglycine-generating enzyme family protein [Polyangiaceae bacterium]
MKRTPFLALTLGVLFAGCGESTGEVRAQWLVSLSTDAPLPQFGDRLVVEILEADGSPACAGCRRLLGVPSDWPATFGVIPPGDGSKELFVRARLYRTESAGNDGLPRSSRVIDVAGRLVAPQGATAVHLQLSMNCFGTPVRLEQGESCDPQTGEYVPLPVLGPAPASIPEPGSWSGAKSEPCAEPAPEGMICVPGGAFLMGAPTTSLISDDLDAEPLVHLSPYALDRDEMTVGEYLDIAAEFNLPLPALHNANPTSTRYYCTYDANDPESRALPVNCLDREQARAVCEVQGKRLPTEAEFEFAAGNRTQETLYPWGNDQDVCHYAALARNPLDLTDGTYAPYLECRETPDGRLAPGVVLGESTLDETELGLRNLGGNLSEWVEDLYADYTQACWQGLTLQDPMCEENSNGWFARRGGAWTGPQITARAAERNAQLTDTGSIGIGVRCATSF